MFPLVCAECAPESDTSLQGARSRHRRWDARAGMRALGCVRRDACAGMRALGCVRRGQARAGLGVRRSQARAGLGVRRRGPFAYFSIVMTV